MREVACSNRLSSDCRLGGFIGDKVAPAVSTTRDESAPSSWVCPAVHEPARHVFLPTFLQLRALIASAFSGGEHDEWRINLVICGAVADA